MSVGVLLGVGSAPFESDILEAVTGPGLHVVRRCLDVADLLATAAARQGAVAVVSMALVGLDTEVVARLQQEQLAVVGVALADSSTDATTLRRLGVDLVVPVDALGSLAAEVEQLRARAVREAHPLSDVDEGGVDRPLDAAPADGVVVAVWGPTGAPGRSTVALGLASYLARSGTTTMLVDADVYGGSQAQMLGLLDESSGLLAATRAANRGSLDAARLAGSARAVSDRLRVLTGLPRADRWVELAPVLLRRVVDLSRALCQVTVVDCGFCVELDEEVSYDTSAPRRNGATLAALETADVVVVVGSADPVGLGRLLRALSDLSALAPATRPRVVVNRMRSTLGWSADEVRELLRRTCGVEGAAFLPDDPAACDAAVVQGRSLAEQAPGSRLGKALSRLAQSLVAEPAGLRR